VQEEEALKEMKKKMGLEDWDLDPKILEGVSFCIPTIYFSYTLTFM